MKLSAPGKPIFLISLVIFILGLLGVVAGVMIGIPASWLLIVAWISLAVGCLMSGV